MSDYTRAKRTKNGIVQSTTSASGFLVLLTLQSKYHNLDDTDLHAEGIHGHNWGAEVTAKRTYMRWTLSV